MPNFFVGITQNFIIHWFCFYYWIFIFQNPKCTEMCGREFGSRMTILYSFTMKSWYVPILRKNSKRFWETFSQVYEIIPRMVPDKWFCFYNLGYWNPAKVFTISLIEPNQEFDQFQATMSSITSVDLNQSKSNQFDRTFSISSRISQNIFRNL